jgi:outer membrane protein assembly factor BamA
VLHFFGYGNSTAFTQPANFYLARQRQLYVYPAWNYQMTPNTRVAVGPAYKHVRTDTLTTNYINQTRPYGVPEFAQFGATATASYDTRDTPSFTRTGFLIRAGGSFYPIVFGAGTPFGNMFVSAAGYVTLPQVPRLTLAMRATGRIAMGEVPVHEASFAGGSTSLRGYESGRYAGDAAAFFNGELRIHVATFPLVVPWQFGVVGIGDVGRVFNVADNDDVWHASAGGGIWFALPDRSLGGVMTIVASPQGTALWFGSAFMY